MQPESESVVGQELQDGSLLEADEEAEFLLSDTNRVLLDANQMLLDLKREIDRKNLLISSNGQQLEELKAEVAKKAESLEQLKKGHKEAIFEKDKLVMFVVVVGGVNRDL